MLRLFIPISLLGFAAVQAMAQSALDLTGIRVNADSVSGTTPALAVSPAGDFVAVWTDEAAIVSRYFSRDGSVSGGELRMGSSSRSVWAPTAAALTGGDLLGGGFVVAWQGRQRGEEARETIFAQRLDASGQILGREIQVTAVASQMPAVAGLAGGGFVVVSADLILPDTFPRRFDLILRRFDSAGVPRGEAVRLNTEDVVGRPAPSLAANPNGLVVAWNSVDPTNSEAYATFARRFDLTGAPKGDTALVEAGLLAPAAVRGRSAVALDSSGNFLVVWPRLVERDNSIQARRFSALGEPLGEAFRVDTASEGALRDTTVSRPVVASDAADRFLVVWLQDGPDGWNHRARFYAEGILALKPQGGEFPLSLTDLATHHLLPALASDAAGNFVATYTGVDFNVHARRLSRDLEAGVLGLRSTRVEAVESELEAVITVQRAGGMRGAASVGYDTVSGSAGLEDYAPASGILTFADGDAAPQEIRIPIFEDELLEADETLALELSRPTGARLIGSASAEVIVLEDDFSTPDEHPAPVEEETLIDDPVGSVLAPRVVHGDQGDFLLVWASEQGTQGEGEILAQAYDASGTLRGATTVVSAVSSVSHLAPQAAWDGSGSYLVVYRDRKRFDVSIFGRRLNRNGAPIGNPFEILDCAEINCPDIRDPSVVRLGTDSWVVAATISTPIETSRVGVRILLGPALLPGQIFSFEGTFSPQVVVTSEEEFLVVARSRCCILAQRFHVREGALGEAFELSSVSSDFAVARNGAGELLLVWSEADMEENVDIYGRSFLSSGMPSGPSFKINRFTFGEQSAPDVAAIGDVFTVVWQTERQDGSGFGIYGQRLLADGQRIGGEFPVNAETLGDQLRPAIDRAPSGRFTVVWEVRPSGTTTTDLHFRRFSVFGCEADVSTLCVGDGRFQVRVNWRDFDGNTGRGRAGSLLGDSGTFWFFQETNLELMVKVLDGRRINDHFWVFYGSLTNVEFSLTVTDTLTGAVREYLNPAGRFASSGDTAAFPDP